MFASRSIALVAAILLGTGMTLTFLTAHSPANERQAQIQAQLAAGEFAPALAAADSVPSVPQRDAILAQIAGSQARAGAGTASLETAGRIIDDRTRTQALAGLGGPPLGAEGGGTMADFDSLIQLITATIQPESWEDVGGPGSVAPFVTGVYIDAEGTLQKTIREVTDGPLSALHSSEAVRPRDGDVRQNSPLRKISLPRLEKEIQLRAAAGKGPTEAMQLLAGLRRIEYLFVYPETGDLVIAGPAGNWCPTEEARIVSTETGEPIVRLEDLIVVLRQVLVGGNNPFGCLIVPTQEGLARVKRFAEESAQQPLKPGTRKAWLAQLKEKLSKQILEVYGIDPRTRVASVILEADYHMKLVGMGLEPGVPGVESYLQLARKDRNPDTTMSVLRWWFTLNYDSIAASERHDAFALRGPGAQVLSENEMLAADGQRIHTGRSDELNRRFADSFTQHFEELCQKYPVYAELRNVCDLALIAALIRRENLAETTQWHMLHFGDEAACRVRLGQLPQTVDSVINDCSVGRGQFIVGVSGGVRIDPDYLLRTDSLLSDSEGRLTAQRSRVPPPALEESRWWWD